MSLSEQFYEELYVFTYYILYKVYAVYALL